MIPPRNAGRATLAPRRVVAGAAALGTVAALGLAACGIPTGEDSFDQIEAQDVPFRLGDNTTTTSTTTTTTTLPPDTAPPTSSPEPLPSTSEVTTTTLPTETVTIYFLSRDGLQPVPNQLPEAYGIAQLAAALEAGPPSGAAGVGLETSIEEGLLLDSTVVAGVVTVELDEELFNEIDAEDLRPASAQIVLTYTSNLRGVGQVSFSVNRIPVRVPKGNGFLSEPGEPLSFDDYAEMIAPNPVEPGSPDPSGPGTSSSVATTTEPAQGEPADSRPTGDSVPPDGEGGGGGRGSGAGEEEGASAPSTGRRTSPARSGEGGQ